ncbi:MAG: hypothetical protein ACRDIY_17230 [Chloroflexota bacterium]
MAGGSTADLCKIMGAAVAQVAAQAEISINHTQQVTDRVAECATLVSRRVADARHGTPADIRAAEYHARQARLSARRTDERAEETMQAAHLTRDVIERVRQLANSDNPRLGELQAAMDEAIRAAIRADRAARLARIQMWKGAHAAIEAAQIRDVLDLVVPSE